jgi:energy-coupling factor transport system permease protein
VLFPSETVIKDILGKKGDSWFHKLDPRTRIIWFGLMFATGFIVLDNLIALLALFVYILILGKLADVTRKQLAMIRIVIPLFVVVVFFNIFLLPLVHSFDQTVILQFPFKYPWNYLLPRTFSHAPVVITRESLYMGMTRGMVLLTLSGVAALFILVIEITELVEGMMLMKIPYKLAFIFGLAINYIPVLFSDISIISEAQRARGYRLDQGNFLIKLKSTVALMLPAINCAYIRAGNIADSMNSRAFGATARRTTLTEREFTSRDWWFLALNIGVSIGGILSGFFADMGLFIRF